MPSVNIAAQPAAREGTTSQDPFYLEWTITLSEASDQPVTVDYRFLSGSAQLGFDTYTGGGQVTFAAGETSKTAFLRIDADSGAEFDESIVLEAYGASGAELAGDSPVIRSTAWILDDDGAANPLALFISNPVVSEQSDEAVFIVSLSRPAPANFSVSFETVDAAALGGTDYTETSGIIEFVAGQKTAAIRVPILNDATDETTESFSIELIAPDIVGAVAGGEVTIEGELPDSVFSITATDFDKAEGNSGLTLFSFTITREGDVSSEASVVATLDLGTADRSDFGPGPISLNFPFAAGETTLTTFVGVLGDRTAEADETFGLTLSNPVNAAIGIASANGVIRNDDGGNVGLSLSLPDGLEPGLPGAAALAYSNFGAQDYAGALLVVSASAGLVRDPFTGDYAETVFIFGDGGEDGVWSLGETGTVDVQVKGTAGPSTRLFSEVGAASQTAPIDVGELYAGILPDYLSDAVVARLQANVDSLLGDTIASLTQALGMQASVYRSLALSPNSATANLAYALEIATDFGSIEERGIEGSLGQGWSTLADISLSVSDGQIRVDGLTAFGALASPSIDNVALYTASTSIGRSVSLGGSLLPFGGPDRPVFFQIDTGRWEGATGADGVLSATAFGYALDLDNGDRLEFDRDGNLLRMRQDGSTELTVERNAAGLISKLIGANDTALAFQYDAAGHITRAADADGDALTFTYNAAGQLAGVTGPEGTSSFSYNADGDLIGALAPGDIAAALEYDALGRLVGVDIGGGAQTESFAYDGAGGITVSDGAGHSAKVTLLPGGIIAKLADGLGGESSLVFDAAGDLVGLRASDGTETALVIDDEDRLLSITDVNGATVSFDYLGDSAFPSAFTDAGGAARNFSYDSGGRIIDAQWSDGTQLTFGYDGEGNLTDYANRRGDMIDFDYDPRGRLLSESDSSSGATSYVYEASGRLTDATDDDGTTHIEYDAADRIVQIDYPTGRSLFYTYTEAGLRSSVSDNGDYFVRYEFDAAGRLSGLFDADNAQIVGYTYDSGGNLVREENGNGTVTTYEYDAAGRLTEIENLAPDTSVNSRTAYSYDVAGQRVAMDTLDGSWTYGYDAIGQLTSASFASANGAIADKAITYEYDAAGNRTRVVEDGAETLYTANALNQYTQVGDATLSYDADGNLLSKTDPSGTATYTYDIANRLTGVSEADGTVLTFEYDIFGNRTAKTVDGETAEYLVDPFGLGNVLTEIAAGGAETDYVHGLGLVSRSGAGGDGYYDADGVGTVTTLTDASGAVANTYVFDPFGNELFESETITNGFEFNGVLGIEEDSDTLLFMRAREYETEQGRFLSEDPLFINSDIYNLYRFGLNQPTSFYDASGLRTFTLGGSGSLVLGVGIAGGIFYDQDTGDYGIYLNGRAGAGLIIAVGGEAGNYSNLNGLKGVGLYAEVDAGISAGGSASPGGTRENPNPSESGTGFTVGAGLGGGASAGISGTGTISFKPIGDFFKTIFGSSDGDVQSAQTPVNNTEDGANDGDPHLRTFDGLRYDFQGAGEYILFRSEDLRTEFQVRLEPYRGSSSVTVNSAIAAQFGDDRVAIHAGEAIALHINGEPFALAPGETIAVGGGSVYFSGSHYIITDAQGSGVWVRAKSEFLNIRTFVSDDQLGQIQGLLGNADGDRTNEFELPDGTILPGPLSYAELYLVFGEAWRISGENSFFDYAPGESTASFTMRDFPTGLISLDDLDPAVRAQAEAIAQAAGLTPGTAAFEGAVLDVALTGLTDFAENAAEAEEFVPLELREEPVAAELVEMILAQDDGGTGFRTDPGFVLTTASVFANDASANLGDPVSLVSFDASGAAGIVTSNGDGTFIYDPDGQFDALQPGESVTDSFTYTITDPGGQTASAAVTVTIAINTPPSIDPAAQPLSTLVDTGLALTVSASDADGDALAFSAGTPGNGTVFAGTGGEFVYLPDPGFAGTDSFTVTVDDGLGGSAVQTVQVLVTTLPDSNGFSLFTADGFAGGVGGFGQIFGTAALQDIAILNVEGAISFDPSFNRGGDIIRLSGDASAWSIVRSGSSALLSDGDTAATIPVGTAGVSIVFADGVRTLRFDAGDGAFKIGDQAFAATLEPIAALDDGTMIPTGVDASARAALFLAEDGRVSASGTVDVFGTTGDELVTLLSGILTFDPSFNRGGDTLAFDEMAGDFLVSRNGSSVFLDGTDTDALVPVGAAGATLVFGNGEDMRTVLFDTVLPGIVISGQVIGSDPIQLTAA